MSHAKSTQLTIVTVDRWQLHNHSVQSHTAFLCIVTTGDCLLDVPESPMPLPSELPGIKYSLDQQCQQIFGEEFSHCPNTSDSDVCSQLWCQEDGTTQCTTKNGSLPWADGTPCGLNETCLRGTCMPTQEVMRPLVRAVLLNDKKKKSSVKDLDWDYGTTGRRIHGNWEVKTKMWLHLNDI